jgi:hypothetical protein
MPKPRQERRFDPAAFTLHSQESFYTAADLECAAKEWPRQEIERAFAAYRAAIDVGDHAAMAALLTEDGRGGNATFGLFEGRASYAQFLEDCWPETIPNYNVWQVVDGGRVVNRWCEVCLAPRPEAGATTTSASTR